MKLVKCNNGHFYDADKEATCPHCIKAANGEKSPVTVGLDRLGNGATVAIIDEVAPVNEIKPEDVIELVEKEVAPVEITPIRPKGNVDAAKTQGMFDDVFPPVVGWLVCVEGPHFGEDFRLKVGGNFVGRSSMMDVALTNSRKVSRDKHAVVVFEPKESIFLVNPGDSRELFYLNGRVVLQVEKMKAHDILEIGDLKLMLIPLCGEAFHWEDFKKN